MRENRMKRGKMNFNRPKSLVSVVTEKGSGSTAGQFHFRRQQVSDSPSMRAVSKVVAQGRPTICAKQRSVSLLEVNLLGSARLHPSIIVCIIVHIWSARRTMATFNRPLTRLGWGRPADLSNKDVVRRLSPAAVKGFLRVAGLWELRHEEARQLLGGMSNGAYYELKKAGSRSLDQDRLTRISLLTGIFKALNILYRKELADRWVHLPNTNPMFGGETPLAYMIKGGMPAIVRVRQLLDARRGGR